MEYVAKGIDETITIAKSFANTLTGGEVVLLSGELGAGKTTFTKGLALGLEIFDTVTSPTFTIMNEYSGRLKLYHFDMYRLVGEPSDLGFEEYFGEEDAVCVIEWPIEYDYGRTRVIRVDIEYLSEDKRRIAVYEDLVH